MFICWIPLKRMINDTPLRKYNENVGKRIAERRDEKIVTKHNCCKNH